MSDDEIHPELAIELVRKLRRRGGAWRLWQTGILLTSPVWLLMGVAAASPVGILVGGLATALLARNLVQNSRAIRAAEFLKHVDALPKPLVAVMEGHRLRIRSAAGHARPSAEGGLWISAGEERLLRQLALPAARVVED